MSQNKLREAADGVFEQLKGDEPTLKFDPAIIMVIIEALKVLLPLVIEWCDKEAAEVGSVASAVLQPTSYGDWTSRWWARRSLIKELGRRQYNAAGGDALLFAICRQATQKTVYEIEALYEQVQG